MKKPCVVYALHEKRMIGGTGYSLANLLRSVRHEVDPILIVRKGGNDPVYKYFQDMGIRCIVVPFKLNKTFPPTWKTGFKFPFKLLAYYLRQARCLKQAEKALAGRHIDIVHSSSSVIGFGYCLARRLGAAHVWHLREFQDLDFHFRPLLGWHWVQRRIAHSDAVISITQAVAQHWHADRAPRSLVLWNAVRSRNEACYRPDKKKYFVFCAAKLSDAKGADTAIAAFGQSGLARQGYRLHLLGNCTPAYRKRFDALAERYNVAHAVCYKGYTSDIRSELVSATAFLMCSQNEGMGRVTVEALFYGCPVIARNSGGTPEFIHHGSNGLLFSQENECACFMQQVAQTDCEPMARAGLKTAIDHFSEEEYGKKIIQLYAEVLQARNK